MFLNFFVRAYRIQSCSTENWILLTRRNKVLSIFFLKEQFFFEKKIFEQYTFGLNFGVTFGLNCGVVVASSKVFDLKFEKSQCFHST